MDTSSDGAPARGTIRTEETSPATRPTERGCTWSMGVAPSRLQPSWRRTRSSSSTGVVSFLNALRTPTGSRLDDRRVGSSGADRRRRETGRQVLDPVDERRLQRLRVADGHDVGEVAEQLPE